MEYYRSTILVFILLLSNALFAQNSSYYSTVNTFKSGEKVFYKAVYNWGFIWINAAEISFVVKDTLYQGKNCYHFKSTAKSLKQYDWFYKVQDRFESIASKDSLKPYWFLRDTYEGGYIANNNYIYNYQTNILRITSFTSDRIFKDANLPLKPCTFDVLTAIYICRNINFAPLTIDQKIPLTMAIDNEVYDLYIRFLGREKMALRGGKTYSTFKFSVMLVKGTIFKGGEDLFVWVTDDSYHIPVLIEAKILFGSVKAILVGVEGI